MGNFHLWCLLYSDILCSDLYGIGSYVSRAVSDEVGIGVVNGVVTGDGIYVDINYGVRTIVGRGVVSRVGSDVGGEV